MITRIVKMTFKPENIKDFLKIFNRGKSTIKATEGCLDLKLQRALKESNVFFTLSIWTSEAALNEYRSSAFFKETWSQTKILFESKAQAWSTIEQKD